MSFFSAGRSYRLLMIACLMSSSSLQAHHAAAPHYDTSTTMLIEGAVITEFKMVNPHSFVYFDALGEDNTMANWRCELRPGSVLKRNGWTQETFAEGLKVSVKGSPARREDNHCLLREVIFSDGTAIKSTDVLTDAETDRTLVQADEAASDSEPSVNIYGQPVNISGNWLTRDAVRGDIGGGRNAPPNNGFEISAAGAAANVGYDPSYDDPSLHCHPINMIQGLNHDRNVNRIVQLEDRVVITYGFVDFVRTIYLDSEHPDQIELSTGGHSIGRWEEDVLVVDSVGFLPGVIAHRVGIRHSDQFHTIEKFYIDEASGQLVRDYILEDSKYLTAPFTGQDRLVPSAIPYSPYNCTDLTGTNSIRRGD